MDDRKVGTVPAPARSLRNGTIELLQVLSLLMIPVALLLPEIRTLAICTAVLLGAAPFVIVLTRALMSTPREAPARELPEPVEPPPDPELRHP